MIRNISCQITRNTLMFMIVADIVTLKQRLKSTFLIFRKQQKNNWQNDNCWTIGHKQTILGSKRVDLAFFDNI